MRPDDQGEWVSTSWAQIEAAVDEGGFREGFVKVFLEFRNAILDDEPLDAKGAPKLVNQSNFAKHFGIAISTFNRWLGLFGGSEFAELNPGGTATAKERQKAKASKKNKAAATDDVRRMVASTPAGFADKLSVHRLDSSMWWLDCQILIDSDMTQDDKAKVAEQWLEFLDTEAQALETTRERLLEMLTEHDATNGVGENAA